MPTTIKNTDGAPDGHSTVSVTYARVAGLAYLVVILLPILSLVLIQPHLIQKGDVVGTASRIADHQQLFRFSLALDLLMFAGVLVLSAAHYVVLETVNRNLSLIALLFRGAEAILGCVTVLAGAVIAVLVGGSTSVEGAQVAALIDLLLRARTAGMDFLLVMLCLGAIPFCYLFYRSRYIPRLLSGFGIACYALIFLGSLTNIITPRYADWTVMAFVPGTLFEIAIGGWLLFKGVNVEHWNGRSAR